MLRLKVDASKGKARIRKMLEGCPDARRTVVAASARMVLNRALATAKRDTNRYANGWAQAGNAAGIGLFRVRPLNKASRFNKIEVRLRGEVDWWARIVNRYDRVGRRDKWYARAARRLARAREEYERLMKAEDGAVIAINAFSSLGSKRAPRALFKTYGGMGRIMNIGSRTYVVLRNLEPHSSIVERNTRNMRNAASFLKGSGLSLARTNYLRSILKGSSK